jgi:hypothetical protein
VLTTAHASHAAASKIPSMTQNAGSRARSAPGLEITIESMISICRDHSCNAKRWRDGQMALRWCAAGMVEAGKHFRRVNGHLHLRSLRDTLNRVTETVGTTGHHETVNAA